MPFLVKGAKRELLNGDYMIQTPAKLLTIFIDETDTWNNTPLYEAIVRRLRQLDVAGATVHIGAMGYGSHGKVHRKRLFGVSDDRPVTISVVENAEKLRGILPEIQPMVREGLITLSDVEVVE
jgi:PII-like signaling protein